MRSERVRTSILVHQLNDTVCLIGIFGNFEEAKLGGYGSSVVNYPAHVSEFDSFSCLTFSAYKRVKIAKPERHLFQMNCTLERKVIDLVRLSGSITPRNKR